MRGTEYPSLHPPRGRRRHPPQGSHHRGLSIERRFAPIAGSRDSSSEVRSFDPAIVATRGTFSKIKFGSGRGVATVAGQRRAKPSSRQAQCWRRAVSIFEARRGVRRAPSPHSEAARDNVGDAAWTKPSAGALREHSRRSSSHSERPGSHSGASRDNVGDAARANLAPRTAGNILEDRRRIRGVVAVRGRARRGRRHCLNKTLPGAAR